MVGKLRKGGETVQNGALAAATVQTDAVADGSIYCHCWLNLLGDEAVFCQKKLSTKKKMPGLVSKFSFYLLLIHDCEELWDPSFLKRITATNKNKVNV